MSVLVAIYANFTEYPLNQALKLTGFLLVLGVLPIWFYINRKVEDGKYADHDVSARTKRPTLYMFSLGVLLVLILVLYFTHQPQNIVAGALAAWILALLSFAINFKLKTSLHTGFAFLIAFLTLRVNFEVGLGLIGFAFLVGWSRVTLGRHTLREAFMGAALGSIVGSIFYGYVI